MVGLDAKNRIVLHKRFICPICSLIIRNPIQLMDCGHRLCQSCFNTIYETIIKCPKCLMEIQREVMIDRGFQRDMQSLPIECSFCCWIGVWNHYQDHLNYCHPMESFAVKLSFEEKNGLLAEMKTTEDILIEELAYLKEDDARHYTSYDGAPIYRNSKRKMTA